MKQIGVAAVLWTSALILIACGGESSPSPSEVVEGMAEQVAAAAGSETEESESPSFDYREIHAMRITDRVEDLRQGSYMETILEYQSPDRTRDVTTTLEGPDKEPTVVERIFTSEKAYMLVAGKWMTMDATQDTAANIEDTLRVHTSPGRLEDNQKARQFLKQFEGRKTVDGVEMLVYYQDDLDIAFPTGMVRGYERTWVGAEDGLVYKIVMEGESEQGHYRSTKTFEYGDSVVIELPAE